MTEPKPHGFNLQPLTRADQVEARKARDLKKLHCRDIMAEAEKWRAVEPIIQEIIDGLAALGALGAKLRKVMEG